MDLRRAKPDRTLMARYRHFDVVRRGQQIVLSLQRLFEDSPAMRLRERELGRRVVHELTDLVATNYEEGVREFLLDRSHAISSAFGLFKTLDRRLEMITARPLSGRDVQNLLAISSRERLRWTKDGKLPGQGKAFIKRGQMISLATYPIKAIEYLFLHPEIIDAWRRQE